MAVPYVPLEDLLKQGGSLYKLVLVASKRALELAEGAPKLVAMDAAKVSTIALEEIRQGKVRYYAPEEDVETARKTKKKK